MRNTYSFGGIDPFESTDQEDPIGSTSEPFGNMGSIDPSISGPIGKTIEGPTGPGLSDFDNLSDLLFTDTFEFAVYYKPILKLIEIDYSNWVSTKVLDFPPTPPVVHFWPLKDVANRFNIALAPSSGEIRQFPITLRPNEAIFFASLINQQKSEDGKVTFKYEGEIASYEMFRIEKPPVTWKSFLLDPTSTTKVFAGFENFLFQENIQPNKEYYYTFRAYDHHLKFSNPSPIYKVRIYENDGVEFLEVLTWTFPKREKKTTKAFKRFIRITPALEQQTYMEPNPAIGREGKLGLYSESAYNQKFVLRIVSKHTGKLLDIVLQFDKEDII